MLGLMGFYQVPQGHAVVLERFGKFSQVLSPGLNWVNPMLYNYKNLADWKETASKCGYLMELTEQQIETDMRRCNTKDNVTVDASARINFRIIDPVKAAYAIDVLPLAIEDVCLNVLRSQIGQHRFDDIFARRAEISTKIAAELEAKTKQWGIDLLGVEVGNLNYDQGLYKALQQKRIAEAEREAKIVAIEAAAMSAIKEKEGQLRIKSLEADIKKIEVEAESEASKVRSRSQAQAIEVEAMARAKSYAMGKEAEKVYLKELIAQVGKEDAVRMINTQRAVDGMVAFANNESSKVIMLPNDFKGIIKLAGIEEKTKAIGA